MLLMNIPKNFNLSIAVAKILFGFLSVSFLLIFPTGFTNMAMFLLSRYHLMLVVVLIAPFTLLILSLFIVVLFKNKAGELQRYSLLIYRISWLTLFCMLLSFFTFIFLYMIYGMGDGYIVLLIPKLINNSLFVILGASIIQYYKPHLPKVIMGLLILFGYIIYPVFILPLG